MSSPNRAQFPKLGKIVRTSPDMGDALTGEVAYYLSTQWVILTLAGNEFVVHKDVQWEYV